MEIVILSMTAFAVISTILNVIDSFKTRDKVNEIISKHNSLVESLQKAEKEIEKEIENLKNQIK